MVLIDVRHVPKMRFSFIFVRKLDDEGYQVTLERVSGSLLRVLLLARGKKNNTLYKTETRLVKGEVNIVENEASIEL